MFDELFELDNFALTGPVQEVVTEVDDAMASINKHRPLSTAVVTRLQSEILADRVHSSAVTEGNRLSRRETLVVLSSGIVEAGSRKDSLEVRNLAQAIIEMERVLREGEALSSAFVRHLQGIILQDVEREGVGIFRQENVVISGAVKQPPVFQDVPILLDRVILILNAPPADFHPLQLAAWAHWVFARIHPFRDGNGRIARLIQDFVLIRHHLVPAPLRSEDRDGGYYDALESADLGEGQPFVEILAKNVLRMADRYRSLITDEQEKASWIANVTKAASEKVRQSDHRRFLSVQRSLAALKAEYQQFVSQLNGHIPGLRVRLADYGDVDFEKFRELERSGTSKKTWLFGVEFRINDTVLRYVFWYTAHHARPTDPVRDLPSKVVVLVSMQQQTLYQLLDDAGEQRVSLREIIPDGISYWRRRYNPINEAHDWDYEMTAGTIARDFLQEVLGKLGLI